MKKILALLLVVAFCQGSNAQDPVLSFDGDLYFIPGTMTKGGDTLMVSVDNSNNTGFTIYDGDFNVVRNFKDQTVGQPYQQRIVTLTRVCDPGIGHGTITRSTTDEWTVIDEQTYDYTTNSTILSFELYSDNNNYHSRYLYVTQTLFDDDEEFEYVRTRQTILPTSIKYSDYVNEHSNSMGNIDVVYPSWGNATLDSIMRETGADNYVWFKDDESGKQLLRLYKYAQYGGVFSEGIEVVTLDGIVKAFLPGITSISSAYYFRGKCYVEGYGVDDSRVLYLLGNETNDIREMRRSKANCIVKRVGNNLIFDSDSEGMQTIVVSTMDGRIVRSLTAKHGSNFIPLNGLQGGVYNITLYRQSKPMKSSKIIIEHS